MKFLIGSFVAFGLALMVFFGGVASNSTALIMLSCLSSSIFAWPAVVLAIYRVFSGAAGGRLMWVSADAAKPASKRPASKSILGDL